MACVRKKDGSLRLCIDYRELNKKIMPDRMPIPRIEDVLENLGGHKYFSTLDMSKCTTKVLCTKTLNILLRSHPSGDFTSGLRFRLVCHQHFQLSNNLSTNVCQD